MAMVETNRRRDHDIDWSRDLEFDEPDEAWRWTEEPTQAERVGMITSVIVVTVSLALLVVWAESRSSFERCSALTDFNARVTCYEELRQQEMRPPAKGATAPLSYMRSGED
jgi:hypothetical protein